MHEQGGQLLTSDPELSIAMSSSSIAAGMIDNGQSRGHRSPSLCARCCNGLVYKRSAPRNVEVEGTTYCHWMGRNVPNDVGSCSRFCDRAQMHLKDMQEIVLANPQLLIDPRPMPGQHL